MERRKSPRKQSERGLDPLRKLQSVLKEKDLHLHTNISLSGPQDLMHTDMHISKYIFFNCPEIPDRLLKSSCY